MRIGKTRSIYLSDESIRSLECNCDMFDQLLNEKEIKNTFILNHQRKELILHRSIVEVTDRQQKCKGNQVSFQFK
jgi:hypothetical protein